MILVRPRSFVSSTITITTKSIPKISTLLIAINLVGTNPGCLRPQSTNNNTRIRRPYVYRQSTLPLDYKQSIKVEPVGPRQESNLQAEETFGPRPESIPLVQKTLGPLRGVFQRSRSPSRSQWVEDKGRKEAKSCSNSGSQHSKNLPCWPVEGVRIENNGFHLKRSL